MNEETPPRGGRSQSPSHRTRDQGSTVPRQHDGTYAQGDLLADVAANTWPGSKDQVVGIIRYLAATRATFTSDDVHQLLQRWPIAMHPSALGAIISGEAKRGTIVADGFEPSRRPEAHRRIVRRWRGAGGDR